MAKQCIELAESVLSSTCLDFKPDNDGPDYWECSMCYRSTEAVYSPPGKMKQISINDLDHEDDCPYILASSLLGISTVKDS